MTKRVELNPVIVRSFLTALIVTAFIAVLLCNEKVHAEETDKTIAFLGTSSNGLSIADPVYPHNYLYTWKGSYVYFGKYEGKSVKYRVLQRETTDYGGKTMFLDCNNTLYNGRYGAYNVNMDTAWQSSIIRSRLNNEKDGFLSDDNFSKIEKAAIARSYRETHETYKYSDAVSKGLNDVVKMSRAAKFRTYRYEPLTGEKVFLLDPEDLYNKKYGYWEAENDDDNRSYSRLKDHIQGYEQFYWLRTPSSVGNSQTTIVEEDGDIYYNISYDKIKPLGISPAFNLNLSEIMFTSLVSGTVGGVDAEYKLTLSDNSFRVIYDTTSDDRVMKIDDTVYIPYRITGSDTGKAKVTQISILVLDKEYTAGNVNGANVLDYRKIADADCYESGLAYYEIPEELKDVFKPGKCYAYLIAEQVNGKTETDYACDPVLLNIPKDSTVPFVWVEGLERPKDAFPFDQEVEVSFISNKSYTLSQKVEWKDANSNSNVIGNAILGNKYKASVELTLTGDAVFDATVYFMNFNGDVKDSYNDPTIVTLSADKKKLTLDCGECDTQKRKVTGVTAPNVPESFSGIYPKGVTEDTYKEFDKTVNVTIEGYEKPETVSTNVIWSEEGTYDTKPFADNSFKWSVNVNDYIPLVRTEGTVSVKNRGYYIKELQVEAVEKPRVKKALKNTVSFFSSAEDNTTGVSSNEAELYWISTVEGNEEDWEIAEGSADWNKKYSTYAFIEAKNGYEFADDLHVNYNGRELKGDEAINGVEVMILDLDTFDPIKKVGTSQPKPDYPEVFKEEYTPENILSANELGRKASFTLNGEGTDYPELEETVEYDVSWSMFSAYDHSPGAVNTFYWKLDDTNNTEKLDDLSLDEVYTDGFVTIANNGTAEKKEETTPSENKVTVSEDGMTGRSLTVLTDLYTISWNKAVPFDTRKHVAVGLNSGRNPYKPKHTKRKTCDLNVIIYKNGEVVDPSNYKLKTYDNRNASVSFDGITVLRDESPYFMIKFKGKNYKDEKKAFNDEKFYFGITPSVLTEENVRFGEIKSGEDSEVFFKKLTHTITISGSNAFSKEVKLKFKNDEKKTDYVTQVDTVNQTVKVTGKNNYYGTVVYKKAG